MEGKIKNYKTLIVLLLVLGGIQFILSEYVTTKLVLPFMFNLYKTFLGRAVEQGGSSFGPQMQAIFWIRWLKSLLDLLLWIPIAVWVFFDAKRDLFTPIPFALFVGLLKFQGIIIYLLIKLLALKEKDAL